MFNGDAAESISYVAVIFPWFFETSLFSPQPFHAVCDLATSQVSLFGTGKVAYFEQILTRGNYDVH